MNKWKQVAVLLFFLGGFCLLACGKDMSEQTEIEEVTEAEGATGIDETVETIETEDSEMFKLYQELVESAQLDWEWVIEPGEYEDFTFLGGTHIAVKKENGEYSVIDENGDFVFLEEYDFISPYSENMAHAENGGNIFYLDEDGNRVIQGAFQSARSFYGQRAAVQMDGKWGFINPDGEVVIECQYEEVNAFQEGYAAVKNANSWGFIDSDGKMIVPCQYDKVKDYSEGLAAIKKDGKWGYIDRTGHMVIELMYDEAGGFSEGKAPVELNNYYKDGLKAWAYINPENTVVIDWFPCYGGVDFREYVGEFHDGLAFVLRDIPTIINENGEEVFESYFFINDYVYDSKYKAIPAYVFMDDFMTERKYGLVGLDGSCLIEPVFDWVWEPYGDYVRVEMTVGGKRCEGAIRIKGKAEETGSQEAEPENNNVTLTKTEAEQIIRKADTTIQMIMEKPKIFFAEQPPNEEEVKAYLSNYYAPDILDYVFFVYQIKIEDGKCFYDYHDRYSNFWMDTESDMEIVGQGDGYYDIAVSFEHKWKRGWWFEEEGTVRIEKNETGNWLITGMSQWYNDFRYYHMPEMDYLPEYLIEDMTEWMIQEFGTDENGEKIQICAEPDENGFILSDSSVREIAEQEIESLSRYEMYLAIQEIYARHGKKFDDVMLYGYFHAKPWYEPYKQVFDENNLTETERHNIGLLTEAGGFGEMAQAAYKNMYAEEEKTDGQALSAEEAACIIWDAFYSLDNIFTAKDENELKEKYQGDMVYYSLGEYGEEQRLKGYVSTWFSEEVFDYLMYMCFIMHGVFEDEQGHYILVYDFMTPMDKYVPDDLRSVVIKDYNDEECAVVVSFLNLTMYNTMQYDDSEGEILFRREGDRWVIAKISEPHYDENYFK